MLFPLRCCDYLFGNAGDVGKAELATGATVIVAEVVGYWFFTLIWFEFWE